MDKLFEGVLEEIIVDDLLIYGEDQTDADHKARRVLDRSRDVKLKVNSKEVKLQVPKGSYDGHMFSADILNQTLTKCDQSVRCILLMTKEELSITWTLEVRFVKRKANLQEPIPQLKM